MAMHNAQRLAKCLSSGRLSSLVEGELDSLLLWLSNPEHPKAAELDRAIGRQHMSRERAAQRAYRMLDRLLFADGEASSATLALPEGSSPSVAKQRYRRLVQVYHPDRHPKRLSWATRRTEQLNRAYATFRQSAPQEHPRGSTKNAARGGRGTTPGLGFRVDGIRNALIGLWSGAWPGRPAWLRGSGRTWQLAIAGAVTLLGAVILFGAIGTEEPVERRPKIIHRPITQTPAETATDAISETKRQPPAPVDQDTVPLASRDQADSEDIPGTPSTAERTEPPAPELEHGAPGQPTKETDPRTSTRKLGALQAETSRDTEPSTSASAQASVTGAEDSPAPETPPIEPPPSEPAPVAADDLAAEPEVPEAPASTAPSPPMPEAAEEEPNRHRAPSTTPTELPNSPPRQWTRQPPKTPELQIPPAAPPATPAPPLSPAPPLQIGSAQIAVPKPSQTTSAADVCGEVPAVLLRFQQNYQAGILDQFMALYSPHAKENDLATWFAIRQTYAKWFRKTSARRIRFEQLRVEPLEEGERCAAAALFQVSYMDAQSLLVTKAGIIQLILERTGTEVRILRMRY